MNKRIGWLDTVRAAAAFFVVLNHGVESVYNGAVEMGPRAALFAVTLFSVGRLGVPMFLFLSGFLLLGREYKTEQDQLQFWKKNWVPLLVCWELWTVIYWVFYCINRNEPMVLQELIEQIFFLKQSKMSNSWYMYMILGMYPFFPFIAAGLRGCSHRVVYFLMGLLGICSMGVPFLNDVLLLRGYTDTYGNQLTLGIGGGAYAVMLLVGYLMAKNKDFSLSKLQDIIGFVASLGFIVIWQLWKYQSGMNYRVWYTFPVLTVAAFFLTDFLRKVELKPCRGLITLVSKCGFGIYLVHKPVQMLLRDSGILRTLSGPVQVIVLTALSFLLSLLGVWLLAKIPGVGKWLFLMKPQKKE